MHLQITPKTLKKLFPVLSPIISKKFTQKSSTDFVSNALIPFTNRQTEAII